MRRFPLAVAGALLLLAGEAAPETAPAKATPSAKAATNAVAKAAAVDPLYRKIGQHPFMTQLRARLFAAMRGGDKKAMAEICAKALEADPTDAVWQYNYACALADGADAKKALDALDRAVTLGFRDADKIAGDTDFAKVNRDPRFKKIVRRAKATAKDPVPGVATPRILEVKAGQRVRMTESNLVWNADIGLYQALVRSDADLYVNRDRDHSVLKLAEFPKVARVDFPREARAPGVDSNLPNTLYGGVPVFGNISLGMKDEPLRRSVIRAALTCLFEGAFPLQRLAACYLDNQAWFIPAVWDFPGGNDWEGHPMGVGGDIYFPGVCPYAVVTVGASYSDLPFLKAVLAARAKMRPDTLKAMRERRLVGPTTQWLVRKSQRGIRAKGDYLTEKAHPTAFAYADLNTNALQRAAAALKPADLPPIAIVQLINTKTDPVPMYAPLRDYADIHSEFLYTTPCAIGIVLRAEPGRRVFCFRAVTPNAKGVEYCWKVVHGDAARVTVKGLSPTDTPEKGFARVEIDRIRMKGRIDLACFARTRGTDWGAPSFVSFSVVAQEGRVYDDDGRLLLIDYRNPNNVPYCDGVIALPRDWKDEYRYGADGSLQEVIRTRTGAAPRTFTAEAFRKLKYKPQPAADRTKFNTLVPDGE